MRALKAQARKQAQKVLTRLMRALKAQALKQAPKALMQQNRAEKAQALKKAIEAHMTKKQRHGSLTKSPFLMKGQMELNGRLI
jgi:hypothetical protein